MADSHNPFASDEPHTNLWSGSSAQNTGGPVYGNAYEDSSNNNNSSWNYGSMRMPEPSIPTSSTPMTAMHRTNTPNNYSANAWDNDKTEVPDGETGAWNKNGTSPAMANQSAYQYSGTRYGNENTSGNAYSATAPEPSTPTPAPAPSPRPNASDALPPVWTENRKSRPSLTRLAFRVVQLIACVGSIGFAAGATPYSHQPVPFDNKALFYFLWAWALISIVWVFFHIFIFISRSVRGGKKISRLILIGVDFVFAVIWGVCVIIEAAQYKCGPGQHYGWCDFYNVSIFWGFLAFFSFALTFFWDIFGSCRKARS
ncbi:hypothetical protein BGW37DRAFT_496653 [Umbelopsis sp. PMI_123]|nr:hypothetical protein BGW37DRAFT_496653 [Umbelopsis sp. PMI_123]